MMNKKLLEAADSALAWLKNVSDADLVNALIECDDTLAYAVNHSCRGTYLTYSLLNMVVDRSIYSKLSFSDMKELEQFDLREAANDHRYALAA